MDNVLCLFEKTKHKPDEKQLDIHDTLQCHFIQYRTDIGFENLARYQQVIVIQQLSNKLRSSWRVVEEVAGITHIYKVSAT